MDKHFHEDVGVSCFGQDKNCVSRLLLFLRGFKFQCMVFETIHIEQAWESRTILNDFD